MKTIRRLPFALLLLAGCAGAPGLPRPAPAAPAGHPGFDTSLYPGAAALQAWRASSPYRWIGYYLSSPCHRETSWAGRRTEVERMGWGIAVLYVGQQAFEDALPAEPADTIICSRTLLTAEQARLDGRDAVTKALADGFPSGTVLYLDVERMRQVSPPMATYYQGWIREVLTDGRYLPGSYAHRANAAALYLLAQAVYASAGRSDTPPFWVAGGEGFTLNHPPAASGLPFADIWQGVLDVDREYGGVRLRVDENVATRPSPSSPGS